MRILIAGAGIGGLAAALALLQRGHEVALFEQAADLGEVGAGLQLSPNAMRVLDALGLGDGVAGIAFEPESAELRLGRSGRLIFSIPLGHQAVARYGARYVHVHRGDLHAGVAQAVRARGGEIHTGHEVVGVAQGADGVEVRFAAGEPVAGDVLIGADGVHSTVRDALFGPVQPRFTGYAAWRLLVPADRVARGVVPPSATVWCGPGRHIVTYYVRGGALLNVVAVVEAREWRGESWTEAGARRDLLRDFEGWHPALCGVLAAGDDETCFKWALFDRAPLAAWGAGRVTLLGDACHPMLPFLAQGAAMALEDAWVLADCLDDDTGAPPERLRAYERLRQPRAARVQRVARANGRRFHRRTAAAQVLDYGPMWLANRFAPSFIASRFDWLYGMDVTRDL